MTGVQTCALPIYVIPVTSIGFVLNAVLGYLFMGEQISPMRWLGTLCIVGGTVLAGITNVSTTEPGK